MPTTEVKLPTSAELRSSLMETAAALTELRNLPADKRGDTYEADVTAKIRQIHADDATLKVVEAAERAEREAAEAEARAKGPEAAFAELVSFEADTLGRAVTDAAEYRSWLESGGEYRNFRFEIDREMRTLVTSSAADGDAAGQLRPLGQPIAPDPRQRRFFIRDLLASGDTNLAAIPYVREVNPATNETAATATPEGEAKAEATIQFATVTALVQKIAAWVPATMEILMDAPTLRSYIDNRLTYMVKVREELDLLYGSDTGSNPTIPGILSASAAVTGVQTQSVVQSGSTDDLPKTLGMSINKVELVDGAADGIAMYPTNYWEMVTARWGTDGGSHDSGSPFAGPPGTVWGLPVVRTRSLQNDTAIVADWRGGGQIFDRMGITVRSSDSHDDYFVKNKTAILAEERLAVCWYRPDFFVNTTVD